MSETEEADVSADPTEVGPDDGGDEAGLDDLPDGIGCVEIWEHLSDRRRED